MTVTLLGILKSGGAYVALDETHPRQRPEFILGDAGAEVLVTRHALLSSRPRFPGRVVLLDADVVSPADGGPTRGSSLTPGDLAYVIYTSGTTGRPKGVMCTKRGMTRLVRGASYVSLSAPTRFLQLSPLTADGAIEFVGRADGQVKLRGFRVETGEVEGVLAEHPDVAQCVVVVREVTPGDPRLVAYLTGGGRSPVSVAGLRAHAEKRLPEYMVPSVMTQLDRLPTTVNGKVDRARLPGPAQRGDRERRAGPAGPAPVSYPGRPEAPDGA